MKLVQHNEYIYADSWYEKSTAPTVRTQCEYLPNSTQCEYLPNSTQCEYLPYCTHPMWVFTQLDLAKNEE